LGGKLGSWTILKLPVLMHLLAITRSKCNETAAKSPFSHPDLTPREPILCLLGP
jgi:hypothetical protein